MFCLYKVSSVLPQGSKYIAWLNDLQSPLVPSRGMHLLTPAAFLQDNQLQMSDACHVDRHLLTVTDCICTCLEAVLTWHV